MNTDKSKTAALLRQNALVVIVRLKTEEETLAVVHALYEGGIRCIEIPMTVPNAPSIIEKLSQTLPTDVALGAGTVTTAAQAKAVIDAGALMVVSPHFSEDVAQVCNHAGILFIPGAFSPLEIHRAWEGGADIVKVFPIRPLGPAYLKDIAGPYPEIPLLPSGGITVENAADHLKAGAWAVTIGGDIVGKPPWDARGLEGVRQRAHAAVERINAHRKIN